MRAQVIGPADEHFRPKPNLPWLACPPRPLRAVKAFQQFKKNGKGAVVAYALAVEGFGRLSSTWIFQCVPVDQLIRDGDHIVHCITALLRSRRTFFFAKKSPDTNAWGLVEDPFGSAR